MELKKLKTLNMTSMYLTAIGSILTPFTHFANLSITRVSLILHGYITKSNINKTKIVSCKFAYTNYKKVFMQLNTYMNGLPIRY